MANRTPPCPACGCEAITFRAHLRGVRDVDYFSCQHCETTLRRSGLAWVPAIFALGIVLVTASVIVDWIGAHLQNRWLLLPIFLGYGVAVACMLVVGSFVNWRFVHLRPVEEPARASGPQGVGDPSVDVGAAANETVEKEGSG